MLYVRYFLTYQNGSAYDTSVITFENGTNSSTLISVYTSNNNKKGNYSMRLIGKFTHNTAYSNYSDFKIIILDECYLTNVTATFIPDQTYTMMDPALYPKMFTISPWSDSYGHCGPLTYTASYPNGSLLPNFIDFNDTQREFTI